MIADRIFRFRSTQLAAHRPRGAALAMIALIGFLASMIGVPVWETPETTSTAPYPCQTRGCGCRSASQCWTGCCCFTNAEKVAWAKEHNVEVPDFVKRLAKLETPVKKPTAACCATKTSCCEKAEVASCCTPTAKAKVDVEKPQAATSQAAKSGRVRIIAGIAALKCRGISLGWQTLGEPIGPPPARVENLEHPDALDELVCVASRAIDLSYPPITPPG